MTVNDYEYEDQLEIKLELLKEQVKYNNTIIKRLTQRNTEIKYKIQAVEEEIRDFHNETQKGGMIE